MYILFYNTVGSVLRGVLQTVSKEFHREVNELKKKEKDHLTGNKAATCLSHLYNISTK